ncbi:MULTISPECIES: AAA family ATPase [Moorena]|uniref:ATPase involved in chromosome partitioning n=1 Tax=Moorena producens 3L TaxID=489825 RepID=F4Y127_9CYAN|nr:MULTISPECIES: AAA family ATPase [Moorena]EGJ29538.1 ATPase involved in chromosome partitioning [Moorena producens 3L]
MLGESPIAHLRKRLAVQKLEFLGKKLKMAILISLFNHKGGVSKTTTTFNLGWALTDIGKKVLIVDGDPQCNLTGTVLGFSGQSDFESFYENNPKSNLSTCLEPAFQGTQKPLEPANIIKTSKKNLYLLAGHLDLAESEAQLAVALSTGAAIPALKNLPGSVNHLITITAHENDIDIVLIDMSPSVGALNQCFLMGSNYFIVPTFPDYFCDQAILSLSRVIPKWNKSVELFRDKDLAYSVPSDPPKFMGIIYQRFRPRSGSPAASFQRWIDRIKVTVNDQLAPALSKVGMTISEDEFKASNPGDTPYNLANIPDFNSLIAQSQKHNVPVFALSDIQIEQSGKVLETMKNNRQNFDNTFKQLAKTVVNLIKS